MENLEHPVSLNSKKCFQEGSKVKKFFLSFFLYTKKSPRGCLKMRDLIHSCSSSAHAMY